VKKRAISFQQSAKEFLKETFKEYDNLNKYMYYI